MEGEFADGEFLVTSASGQGLPLLDDANDLIYELRINETAANISSTPTANPAVQLPPTSLAVGTPGTTTMPLTWVAAANGTPAASDYKVQRRSAEAQRGKPAEPEHRPPGGEELNGETGERG